MILDPDACFYDAANFVTDERTDEQGDSRSWIESNQVIKIRHSVTIGSPPLYSSHPHIVHNNNYHHQRGVGERCQYQLKQHFKCLNKAPRIHGNPVDGNNTLFH